MLARRGEREHTQQLPTITPPPTNSPKLTIETVKAFDAQQRAMQPLVLSESPSPNESSKRVETDNSFSVKIHVSNPTIFLLEHLNIDDSRCMVITASIKLEYNSSGNEETWCIRCINTQVYTCTMLSPVKLIFVFSNENSGEHCYINSGTI